MKQPSLFGEASRCGYCERELQADPFHPGCFACPRCAPILRSLGAGLDFDGMLRAFARFQREARPRGKLRA